jgi:hypothetical protein
MRRLFPIATWISRGILVLTLLASTYDLVRFTTNPGAYPIPSTEVGDPRYFSASRFLWTSSADGGIALAGLLLWLIFGRRRPRVAAASSLVAVAVLIAEARITAYLWR